MVIFTLIFNIHHYIPGTSSTTLEGVCNVKYFALFKGGTQEGVCYVKYLAVFKGGSRGRFRLSRACLVST